MMNESALILVQANVHQAADSCLKIMLQQSNPRKKLTQ